MELTTAFVTQPMKLTPRTMQTFVNNQMKTLENTALDHCKLKENGCREYCEQYCDHFVDMGVSEYYPKCPDKNQDIDRLNEFEPVDEEIENYLRMFVGGKNCLDQCKELIIIFATFTSYFIIVSEKILCI